MESGEPLHEGEAEAQTSFLPGPILLQLHEGVEDALDGTRLDSDPIVPDAKQGLAFVRIDDDVDAPLCSGELRRVLKQVAHDLRDARRVRVDPDRPRWHVQPQVELALLEHRTEVVAGAPHDLPQVEAFTVQLDLAARDAGRIEQVVDEPREMLRLAMDDLHRPRSLVTPRLRSIEDVEAITDRRERVSQLVREDGEEVTLPLVRFSQKIRLALRHFSEATLALIDEVLDGVRDHEVETHVEASELRDPVHHASRAPSLLLRSLRGEEEAQDRHPEQPDLVDELGELERLIDAMRGVRNGGGAHSRRASLGPLHPFREFLQELGNMVPEEGARELDVARLILDERLPLADDVFARFAEEGVSCERHSVSAIPGTSGHVTRPGRHPSGRPLE